MTRLGAGGEEWLAMDGATGYRFDEAEEIVAAQRAGIEKIRKRDVELRVVNPDGRPVAGRGVEIVQTRQEFCFGDNLWKLDTLYRFGQADTDRGRYWKLRFAEVLNAANALCYWTERPRNDGPKTEDVQGFPQLDGFHYCVDWAASQGLTVKGHPLFWSIDKCVPDWVKRYDYETQMKFAEVRVRNIVASVRGRVAMYDVVNEPLWEPAFKDLAGRNWPHITPIKDIADYIEPVIRWAREEDPDACYLVNDYGLENDKVLDDKTLTAADGSAVTARRQRQRMLELMKELTDRGCPPNAIGLQSHTGGLLDHQSQLQLYTEMGSSGLPVHITEFWANMRHLKSKEQLSQEQLEELQARYIANYLTCAFGHPAVEAFFFWGFMGAAASWKDDRTSSHDLKCTYHCLKDLIRNQWMTRRQAVTDADGRVKFRGFFGDYSLRYDLPGRMKTGAKFAVTRQQSMPLTVVASLVR